jgi:hypothetical protein
MTANIYASFGHSEASSQRTDDPLPPNVAQREVVAGCPRLRAGVFILCSLIVGLGGLLHTAPNAPVVNLLGQPLS